MEKEAKMKHLYELTPDNIMAEYNAWLNLKRAEGEILLKEKMNEGIPVGKMFEIYGRPFPSGGSVFHLFLSEYLIENLSIKFKYSRYLRKAMYYKAYVYFQHYDPNDSKFNEENHIQSGLCNFFEKNFGVNLIKDLENFPEIMRYWNDYDRDKYDGNIGPSNEEGAKIRCDLMFKCLNDIHAES